MQFISVSYDQNCVVHGIHATDDEEKNGELAITIAMILRAGASSVDLVIDGNATGGSFDSIKAALQSALDDLAKDSDGSPKWEYVIKDDGDLMFSAHLPVRITMRI